MSVSILLSLSVISLLAAMVVLRMQSDNNSDQGDPVPDWVENNELELDDDDDD